jgi:hypothetical protein
VVGLVIRVLQVLRVRAVVVQGGLVGVQVRVQSATGGCRACRNGLWVLRVQGSKERQEAKAGAVGRERALVAGSAQVKERRVAGYRMPESDAQRGCDGGRAWSAAWMRVGAVMGDGGWGVVLSGCEEWRL